jgi:hypothetical protein
MTGEQIKAHTLGIIRQALEVQDALDAERWTAAQMILTGIRTDSKRLQEHCAEKVEQIAGKLSTAVERHGRR